MSHYGQVKKSCAFQSCVKIMLRLQTAGTENPYTPKTHPIGPDFHEYHLDTPRYSPDIPQTPLRHLQVAGDVNRRQQTPADTAECTQTALVSVFGCLWLSVCVWWHLLLSVGISCCLGTPGGCLGVAGGCLVGVWGYLSGIPGHRRCSDVLGGYLASQSLQYGAVTLFWHSPERPIFFSSDHTETSK